ncbi:MAG: BatA domain-containing protein, partial [Thermoanaerobaculia bacterium]
MMRLAAPEWLAALAILALWCVWAIQTHRAATAAFRISSLELAGDGARGLRVRLAWLPSLLAVAGLALLV